MFLHLILHYLGVMQRKGSSVQEVSEYEGCMCAARHIFVAQLSATSHDIRAKKIKAINAAVAHHHHVSSPSKTKQRQYQRT